MPIVPRPPPAAQLHCADGSTIEYDEVIWCTQGGAQPWLRETGLELDGHGFIAVHPTLEPGSWWTVPSTLSDDGAPSASRDHPTAQAAPPHPRAPPEPLGGVRWPQQPASGRAQYERLPLFHGKVGQLPGRLRLR